MSTLARAQNWDIVKQKLYCGAKLEPDLGRGWQWPWSQHAAGVSSIELKFCNSLVCVLDLQCVSGWWLAGVAWYNAINARIRSVSARARPIITLRARLSAHSTQPKKLCCWWGAAWQWSHVTPARNGWMESYRMSASTYKLGVHMKNWVPLAPILYFVACCDLLIIMVAVRTMAVCLPPSRHPPHHHPAQAGVGGRHIPMEQCPQCPVSWCYNNRILATRAHSAPTISILTIVQHHCPATHCTGGLKLVMLM